MIDFDKKEWIGVDLDGTLARYDKWVSGEFIGDPIPDMVDRVKEWVKHGQRVKIFTARVSPISARHNGTSSHYIRMLIFKWLEKHLGFGLEITHEKDYLMIELWDDMKLIQVKKNSGQPT